MLELREHLLDRVEVGRVWRQVEQLGLGGADGLSDRRAFVAGEVVHDHDVARCEGGHEELLDPFNKAGPVDRLIKDARCIDPVTAECCDEGSWCANGHRAPWRAAAGLGCPAPQGCHIGPFDASCGVAQDMLGPRLVDEDEMPRIKSPLILAPLRAPPCNPGAQLFGGKNAFF
jgi:hypothetical protein